MWCGFDWALGLASGVLLAVITYFVVEGKIGELAIYVVRIVVWLICALAVLAFPLLFDRIGVTDAFGLSEIDANGVLGYYGTLLGILVALYVAWRGWQKESLNRKRAIRPEVVIEANIDGGVYRIAITNHGNESIFDFAIEGVRLFPIVRAREKVEKCIRYRDKEGNVLLPPDGNLPCGFLEIRVPKIPETNQLKLPKSLSLQMMDIDQNRIEETLEPIHDGSNVYVRSLRRE